MLESDSLFGTPGLLLGGLGTVHDDVTNVKEEPFGPNTTSSPQKLEGGSFVLGDLLRTTNHTENEGSGHVYSGGSGVASSSSGLLQRVDDELEDLDEGFIANGLLGEPSTYMFSYFESPSSKCKYTHQASKVTSTQASTSSFSFPSELDSQGPAI